MDSYIYGLSIHITIMMVMMILHLVKMQLAVELYMHAS